MPRGAEKLGSPQPPRRVNPVAPVRAALRLSAAVQRRSGPRAVRFRQPTIRTRGPRHLQAWLKQRVGETAQIPPPSKYLGGRQDGRSLRLLIRIGTDIEWFTAWSLISFGLNADEDWYYQSNQLGGRTLAGGAVLDFMLPAFARAFNVQGIAFHYRSTAEEASSLILRTRLAGVGLRLIFLDEDDLRREPRNTVAAAVRGEDRSRMGQGTLGVG